MPVAPPVIVDATALAPSKFGLLSAADVLPASDPHLRNGVEAEQNPIGPAVLAPSDCLAVPGSERELPDGIPYKAFDPIILYAGFTCRSVGLDENEINARAQTALAVGESAGLEAALWSQIMADDDLITLPASTSLVAGIAAIEDWMWKNYGGTPIIHARRGLSAVAARDHQIVREASRLTTTVGTRWSFGNYPEIGPLLPQEEPEEEGDPLPPRVNESGLWLVGTGQITLRRTDIDVRPGSFATALDRTTNEVYSLAERTYVAQIDAAQVAVKITL